MESVANFNCFICNHIGIEMASDEKCSDGDIWASHETP